MNTVDKIKFLEKTLSSISNDLSIPICIRLGLFTRKKCDEFSVVQSAHVHYPELRSFCPDNVQVNHPWWPYDREGQKQRIKVLKSLIEIYHNKFLEELKEGDEVYYVKPEYGVHTVVEVDREESVVTLSTESLIRDGVEIFFADINRVKPITD